MAHWGCGAKTNKQTNKQSVKQSCETLAVKCVTQLHIIQNTKRHQAINGRVIYHRPRYHTYFGGRIEFSENVGHHFFVTIIYFLEAYIKVTCLSALGTDPFCLGL